MFDLPILPEMQCDDGCGECCKTVLVTEEEFQRVKRFAAARSIRPVPQVHCPWYQRGRCAVYEVRPSVCRVYGHLPAPEMRCPRGYNTNIEPSLLTGWSQYNAGANHLLHEILSDWFSWVYCALPMARCMKVMTLGTGRFTRTISVTRRMRRVAAELVRKLGETPDANRPPGAV